MLWDFFPCLYLLWPNKWETRAWLFKRKGRKSNFNMIKVFKVSFSTFASPVINSLSCSDKCPKLASIKKQPEKEPLIWCFTVEEWVVISVRALQLAALFSDSSLLYVTTSCLECHNIVAHELYLEDLWNSVQKWVRIIKSAKNLTDFKGQPLTRFKVISL